MTSIKDLIHCIIQQQHDNNNNNDDESFWNLYLGRTNHILLEDLDDIQDGDRIVLAKHYNRISSSSNNNNNKVVTTTLQDHQDEISNSSDSEYDEDSDISSSSCSIIDVTSDYNHSASLHTTTTVDDDSSIEDVTDYYQKMKQNQIQNLIEQAYEIKDDGKTTTTKRKQRTTSTKKRTASKKKDYKKSHYYYSPVEVIMKEKDIPIAPGCQNSLKENCHFDDSHTILHKDNNDTKNINESIKNRILKLLNTGFHENSNENEAKNAMKLAQRLMQRHNINQALLLQEYKDNDGQEKDEILKGGLVTVELYHNTSTLKTKARKPMSSMIRWIAYLIYPVRLNFKVEAYKTVSRNPPQCSVTFYGIYTNAQLAAYAFKIACERIASMVASYKPEITGTASFTKKARLSYGLGIVEGLTNDVESNKEKEELRRQEKLKKARDAVKKGEAYEESDNDDDEKEDSYGNEISTMKNHTTTTTIVPSNTDATKDDCPDKKLNELNDGDGNCNEEEKQKKEQAKVRLEVLEKEESATLALIDHHERIAKDILKESNIKVYKASKRRALRFDSQSYQRGIEDSKQIDLDQRAIRGNSQVVKEELRKRFS